MAGFKSNNKIGLEGCCNNSTTTRREYLIFRPEKTRLLDIFKLLVLRRRGLDGYGFVESNVVASSLSSDGGDAEDAWVLALTLLIQKFLAAAYQPMRWIGIILEFLLNLFALNGGIIGILRRIITASVVFPKRDAANFRSFIALIDGRLDLFKTSSLLNFFSMMDPQAASNEDISYLDLSMMTSKIAYENAAYIEDAVTNHWKMNFVGFYNCWNKYLEAHATQALLFTDKAEDAKLIVVAFRGTEPFNAQDWSTDIDLSWLFMGKLGNIHLGFLKALGLQDDKNFVNAFPKDLPAGADPEKPLAYYCLREQLRTLVKAHPNAKIVVTGHSLGGALAAIFPALLSMHNEDDILQAMYGVMTYGQPRVGDAIFASYMTTFVRHKYYRMVYRFDIVPRVPFDVPPVAMFKHFGTCIYYDGWYKGQVVAEAPNPNYFDPLYMFAMYFNAWGDLFKALFIGWTQGKEYREGYVSILYRMSGLVVPGIASHSPRDYVNSGRLAKISNKIMV